MSQNEDESQKTEEPSEYKLEKAKKDGDVFMSKELSSFLSFVATAILLLTFIPWSAMKCGLMLSAFVHDIHAISLSEIFFKKMLMELFLKSLAYSLPIILCLALFDVISSIFQQGFIFSSKSIKPSLNRISLISGMKRLFSLNAVTELIKGLMKISLVGYVLYWSFKPMLSKIVNTTSLAIEHSLKLLLFLVMRMFIAAASIMFFIGIADYLYQRFKYMKKMKMTKQETKDEYKQKEGNPEIRSKIRSMQRAMAQKRMEAIIPKATVVITNPTHYSVALQYEDNDADTAPIVIAKGVDDIALIIREIAKKYKVPIVESPALTRSIYKDVKIDAEIHKSHYKAVAKIISTIISLKNGAGNASN